MLDPTQKIEAYLTGDLSEVETLSFEKAMSSDPSLKAEVDFQRDVIDSLKDYRKAQLKARLNNLDVSAASSSGSKLMTYAASVLAVAGIGAAALYFTSSNDQPTQKENISQVTVESENSEVQYSEQNTQPAVQSDNSDSDNTDASADKKEKDRKKKSNAADNSTKPTNTPSNELTKPVEPDFNMPGDKFAKADDFTGNTADVPSGEISKGAVKSLKGVEEVTIVDSNPKDLSYQYVNNELYLYGDFNSRPYELIEYNSNKSPRLFIKFDGVIYELKNNTSKPTPMTPVSDNKLLEQIKVSQK
ncbi:MAG: hypothetical protein MUF42_14895 [Cytophagaceae bacterium]|jgi:hypothetical protein|nr:hypothetical protein [Cytophagaceae bacterium]